MEVPGSWYGIPKDMVCCSSCQGRECRFAPILEGRAGTLLLLLAQLLRGDEQKRVPQQGFDALPVRLLIENDTHPAVHADIGRPKEQLGIACQQSLLDSARLWQPNREVL